MVESFKISVNAIASFFSPDILKLLYFMFLNLFFKIYFKDEDEEMYNLDTEKMEVDEEEENFSKSNYDFKYQNKSCRTSFVFSCSSNSSRV